MSGKTRLGIFLSIIWLLVSAVVGLSSAQVNGVPGFIVTMLIVAAPVWLGWGFVWVKGGFANDRMSSPKHR